MQGSKAYKVAKSYALRVAARRVLLKLYRGNKSLMNLSKSIKRAEKEVTVDFQDMKNFIKMQHIGSLLSARIYGLTHTSQLGTAAEKALKAVVRDFSKSGRTGQIRRGIAKRARRIGRVVGFLQETTRASSTSETPSLLRRQKIGLLVDSLENEAMSQILTTTTSSIFLKGLSFYVVISVAMMIKELFSG